MAKPIPKIVTKTFRITEEQDEYLRKISGGNVSTYIKERLFGGAEEQKFQLSGIENKLEEITRKLAALSTSISAAGAEDLTSQIEDIQKKIEAIDVPPRGQMLMHEALAIETLLILRQIASPEKMKLAQSETARNGYKTWEPKKG